MAADFPCPICSDLMELQRNKPVQHHNSHFWSLVHRVSDGTDYYAEVPADHMVEVAGEWYLRAQIPAAPHA